MYVTKKYFGNHPITPTMICNVTLFMTESTCCFGIHMLFRACLFMHTFQNEIPHSFQNEIPDSKMRFMHFPAKKSMYEMFIPEILKTEIYVRYKRVFRESPNKMIHHLTSYFNIRLHLSHSHMLFWWQRIFLSSIHST